MHDNILHADNTYTSYEIDMHTFTHTVSPTVSPQSRATGQDHQQDHHRDHGASSRNPRRHDPSKEAPPQAPACQHTDSSDGWLHILHLSNSLIVLDRLSPFSTSLSSSVRYCIA